jgi:hypothetical protein
MQRSKRGIRRVGFLERDRIINSLCQCYRLTLRLVLWRLWVADSG